MGSHRERRRGTYVSTAKDLPGDMRLQYSRLSPTLYYSRYHQTDQSLTYFPGNPSGSAASPPRSSTILSSYCPTSMNTLYP